VKEQAFFVGNLAFHATEDDVITSFESLGLKVSVVVLPRDTDGVRNRGFGFVTALCSDPAAAIERLYGSEIGGRRIRVELAKEPTIKTISGRVW
jgi:cold-inducible RNA-binding protein